MRSSHGVVPLPFLMSSSSLELWSSVVAFPEEGAQPGGMFFHSGTLGIFGDGVIIMVEGI